MLQTCGVLKTISKIFHISHDVHACAISLNTIVDLHIPTDVMMLGLLGATITFVHETIRMMSMCHWLKKWSLEVATV